MSIFEGLIKPTIKAVISPTFNSNCNMTQTVNIENYHNHDYFGKPFFWGVMLLVGYWIVTNLPSCSSTPTPVPAPATFEFQVRQWASDYPADLRDRWAWCYLDSVANFSTEQKLREDVRICTKITFTKSGIFCMISSEEFYYGRNHRQEISVLQSELNERQWS